MTVAEAIQGMVILVLMGVSYRYFWTAKERVVKDACITGHSLTYDVTHTGSMFVPSFDCYMSKGAEIIIPTGDGLYARRVKQNRGSEYREGLVRWMRDNEAIIHIVVTIGGKESIEEWQWVKDLFPNQLRLYLLRPELASGPDAEATRTLIEKLHTFHPALLVNKEGSEHAPGAMWIEHNHPVGSKYAYHVEWVVPSDTAKDGRFGKYRSMYSSLLEGPHVWEAQASVSPAAIAA